MTAYPKPAPQEKTKKRRPKTERTILEAELDELVRQIVYRRDGPCVTPSSACGGLYPQTVSHYHKRGKSRIRWDLRNCNCQCSNHNGLHNRYHGIYEAYMLKRWGADVVAELAELSKINEWKWTVPELRDIKAQLEAELKNIQDTGGGCSICGHGPAKNISGTYWLCPECEAERLENK